MCQNCNGSNRSDRIAGRNGVISTRSDVTQKSPTATSNFPTATSFTLAVKELENRASDFSEALGAPCDRCVSTWRHTASTQAAELKFTMCQTLRGRYRCPTPPKLL
eukprot:3926853-Rhodomonas_salina.2